MPRGRPKKTNREVLIKSAEFIGWALGGLEREIAHTRERLSSLTAEAAKLRARVGAAAPGGARSPVAAASFDEPAVSRGASSGRGRRKLSPAARKRISERMKKRWADWRKNNPRSS